MMVRFLGATIDDTVYRFVGVNGTMEKLGREFQADIFVDQYGNEQLCMVCVGTKSNATYWTWTLNPEMLKATKKRR